MHKYGALCDEFFMNMHLSTEMELPQNRESVLHFFEQIQKRFPDMTNFYSRDKGEYCLEEEKLSGRYRWVNTEPRRISSGAVNPDSIDEAVQQHQCILGIVPFALSISHLDCESLSLTMGFDYSFRGNHNQLLVEALGMTPPLEPIAGIAQSRLLSYEPVLQFALDDDCRTQCRLSFESRTTAFQVRTEEFSDEPLSVYLTVRRFDSLMKEEEFAAELERLAGICERLADEYLVEQVLRPLQQTIATK